MILTTLTDHLVVFKLSIASRIRIIFFFFSLISLSGTVLIYSAPSAHIDFSVFYKIFLPVSVITCLVKVFRPSIGDGSLYLLPLFFVGFLRVVDYWLNAAQGDTTFEWAVRGTVGWSFLLISIAYIDLLESRIYHRMVHYIEQETD